jgi:glycosyltransferase involved in cell wall biosynthesis
MKIIRTIESFYPKVHGPANQAFKISSELENKKIRSPVFTTFFDVKNVKSKEKIVNVFVKRFKSKYRIFKYIFSPKMKKSLFKNDFDIMHGHCYRSYQSDIGYSISKKKNKAFVLSTHGTLTAYKHFVKFPWNIAFQIYDLLTLKRTAKKADAVIVNSGQEYKEALNFGIRKNRLHLIPVGINIKDYKVKRDFKDNKTLRLLYIGRITRNRPLKPTLKAVNILNSILSKRKVELTVIGSEARSSFSGKKGYLNELKKYVKVNNLMKHVTFISELNKKELKKYYKNSDVFIYPSVYENFGQPILEAATAGLPVICSRVGIAKDLFLNEKQQLFMTNNPKQIASQVSKLINPALRKEISRYNLKVIKEKFTWDQVMLKYFKLYRSLI